LILDLDIVARPFVIELIRTRFNLILVLTVRPNAVSRHTCRRIEVKLVCSSRGMMG
jgi:hypothetical protein